MDSEQRRLKKHLNELVMAAQKLRNSAHFPNSPRATASALEQLGRVLGELSTDFRYLTVPREQEPRSACASAGLELCRVSSPYHRKEFLPRSYMGRYETLERRLPYCINPGKTTSLALTTWVFSFAAKLWPLERDVFNVGNGLEVTRDTKDGPEAPMFGTVLDWEPLPEEDLVLVIVVGNHQHRRQK